VAPETLFETVTDATTAEELLRAVVTTVVWFVPFSRAVVAVACRTRSERGAVDCLRPRPRYP